MGASFQGSEGFLGVRALCLSVRICVSVCIYMCVCVCVCAYVCMCGSNSVIKWERQSGEERERERRGGGWAVIETPFHPLFPSLCLNLASLFFPLLTSKGLPLLLPFHFTFCFCFCFFSIFPNNHDRLFAH